MVFVTCLVTANIIAVKLVALGDLVAPAALIIFPLSYVFGDVLTEVYGYQNTRRIIWLAFGCNLLAVLAISIGQALPAAAPFPEDAQRSYERILGYTPRLLAGSFVAYLVGEFANAMVLARMKAATRGRWLWTRTIASTIVGQGLDTAVFNLIAFGGTVPGVVLTNIVLTAWTLKVLYEALVTPFTYLVVNFLKKQEGMDVFDIHTDFNPIGL
ncbi:MAG: queuosine precursor transporter [Chloroflexi bacterium]|nr:queuosine precursor transporter [Chloroflexota bacterium]